MMSDTHTIDDSGPDLQDEHEHRLWHRFLLDRSLIDREALFDLYLPYATALASRLYRGRHYDDVEYRDYVQLACIGLLEAIDRFEVGRNIEFRTFATPRIKGNVLDGIVRLSDGQEQVALRARIRRERLESLHEAADRRAKDVFHSLASLTMGLAIGFILDDTGMIDRAPDVGHHHNHPYRTLAWSQVKARLAEAVAQLPDRERKVLQYHYFHGLTFERIGDILDLSKGRVSQLHRTALAQLRKHAQVANDLFLIT